MILDKNKNSINIYKLIKFVIINLLLIKYHLNKQNRYPAFF